MREICDDLTAEHDDLDHIVSALDEAEWSTETPSPGWVIRDQISHLWFFDQRALLALTDPDAFVDDARSLLAQGGTDASVEPGRSMDSAELLRRWRQDREQLVHTALEIDPSTRVPWYGPPMAARSFVTARLMETWAHGQDVADALGVTRRPTRRLRHVAHIGVRARPFSYSVHSMSMPGTDVAVRLTGPDGEIWEWGESSSDVVSGPALDFCLVVTQRRHLADPRLNIEGDAALEWMAIAQAFAGGIGQGRRPGQFQSAVDDPPVRDR